MCVEYQRTGGWRYAMGDVMCGMDDGTWAEELLAHNRAPNGRVYMIEPTGEQMLRTNGEAAGKHRSRNN
jgi:hypothetical protein